MTIARTSASAEAPPAFGIGAPSAFGFTKAKYLPPTTGSLPARVHLQSGNAKDLFVGPRHLWCRVEGVLLGLVCFLTIKSCFDFSVGWRWRISRQRLFVCTMGTLARHSQSAIVNTNFLGKHIFQIRIEPAQKKGKSRKKERKEKRAERRLGQKRAAGLTSRANNTIGQDTAAKR